MWVAVVVVRLKAPHLLLRGIRHIVEWSGQRRMSLKASEVWRAVASFSRFMPGASCLVGSLAVGIVCSGSGLRGQVLVGVRHSRDGDFEAHAWVELDNGQTFGLSSPDYRPLWRLDMNKLASCSLELMSRWVETRRQSLTA